MAWQVLALILCLGMSAFFSASETAYSAVNKIRLKTVEGPQKKKAETALALAEDYDRLLMAILVGNNIVNIAAASISTLLFTELLKGNAGATVSTVVMTVLVLIFGEISPKTLAKESPERVAMAFAGSLKILCKVLSPLGLFFKSWKKMLRKIFKKKDNEESIVEAELMTIVDEARHEGDMDEGEGELIRSAIEFNDQDALSIMTPRVDVTALEDTATPEEAADVFRQTGYSRLPVYHEDMDHITGILHEKDFYKATYDGVRDIRQIMHDPVFAPANLQISKLLKLFQETKSHQVVLLDEYGGTEGIVTMEDVLEELVGEIYDEHDDVDVDVAVMDDGSVIIDGGVQLEELLERYQIPDTFEADTVGGWAAEMLERIPKEGDLFELNGLRCEVVAMDKRRVASIKIVGEYTDPKQTDRG